MNERFQEYFAFMDKLGDLLDRLTAIANEKNAAVRKDDLLTVNECMKREQVISLELRSMDRKREKLLSDLGLRGVKLSGLVEHCPPELRPQALAAVDKLRSRYQIYQSASESARLTMELNLHEIEKMIAARGSDPAGAMPPGRGTFTDIRA